MEYKTCPCCGKLLPETNDFFSKQSNGKNGLNSYCKKCCCEKTKQYYKNNKEKCSGKMKQYYSKERETKILDYLELNI